MTDELDMLRKALRRMPAPEPRSDFVDQALAKAVSGGIAAESSPTARPGRLRHLITRWETWVGVAFGGAVAAMVTVLLLHPAQTQRSDPLALTLHELRTVDVLIDSERELKGASISVTASGSIILDGFEDEHQIGWRANVDRGRNVLSLPVVASTTGKGRLVAIIEHEGRSRRVAIDLTVVEPDASRS